MIEGIILLVVIAIIVVGVAWAGKKMASAEYEQEKREAAEERQRKYEAANEARSKTDQDVNLVDDNWGHVRDQLFESDGDNPSP